MRTRFTLALLLIACFVVTAACSSGGRLTQVEKDQRADEMFETHLSD